MINRFQLALQSQIGTVFIALLVFLAILGIIYWYLVIRQKNRDMFSYLYRAYFEKADGLAKNLEFIGGHKADFFGRRTTVKLPGGIYGQCLVPPPIIADETVRDRFRCFHRAIQNERLPVFAQYLWKSDEEAFVLVQGGLSFKNGRPYPNMQHYLMDKRLTDLDKEKILFEIARALARLHDLKAETGGSCYHGFLLPRSIYMDFDERHNVNQLVVADNGLVFSIGPEKLCKRLKELREGKLPIEKFCANELLDQLPMLAPELKNPMHTHEAGPPADFFSFSALATMLFTQKRFTDIKEVNWLKVPTKWCPFLQSCLAESVTNRPRDFMELADWLTDPELGLTHHQNADDELLHTPAELGTLIHWMEDLSSLSKSMNRKEPGRDEGDDSADRLTPEKEKALGQLLEAGFKAMKVAKWNVARKHYKDALKIVPDHAEANVKLAISCYEMGDLKNAEIHYAKAKNIDPALARSFREHIAFRV